MLSLQHPDTEEPLALQCTYKPPPTRACVSSHLGGTGRFPPGSRAWKGAEKRSGGPERWGCGVCRKQPRAVQLQCNFALLHKTDKRRGSRGGALLICFKNDKKACSRENTQPTEGKGRSCLFSLPHGWPHAPVCFHGGCCCHCMAHARVSHWMGASSTRKIK